MNYNSLMNKPTINYRELIGDNTVSEVGGITEEEFNTLMSTDLTSYYTKAQIDDLFSRSYVYREKSGNIVTFDCPASVNGIDKVVSEIVAVQSGTGDPSPTNVRPISGWSAVNVTRCGKNLFDKTATDTNKGFIQGKWINQTGNTFSYSDWNVSEYIRVDGEKIAVSGMSVAEQISVGRGGYCCYDKYKNVLGGGIYNALTQIITLPTNTEYIRISVWNLNKDVCQLEIGDTPSTYEPYNGHTYTIDLGGTRYGCTLDVVSGVLTVKWIAVSLGNINYTKSPSGLFQTNEIANAVKKSSYSYAPTGFIKSSHFREIDSASITGPQGSNPSPDGVMAVSSSGMLYFNYWAATDVADFNTAMASATLVYELATPLTIQLTPTMVKSLLGTNNIWADTGDITVNALDKILQG